VAALCVLFNIMTEKPSDDIFALCSRFDLDQESYRVFPKSPLVLSSDNSEPTSEVPLEIEPERSVSLGTLAHSNGEQDSTSGIQASRAALRNLWRHLEIAEGKGKRHSFHELIRSSVFVYGTAGGVGTTTISATLARLFAKAGQSCALVDDRSESVLPFFFGEQRAIYTQKRYAGLSAASETAVRMITRQAGDAGASEDEATGDNSWLERSVAEVQYHLDHLVVDVQRGKEPALPEGTGPIALLVAVPDVSSLMGARALKRILSEKAVGSKVICLLNKFDFSQALHAEIHGWFQENFAQVLTIGRSDLLSEALAEGLTVVDWMPQSAIATDFTRLLTVIQATMPTSFHSQQKGGHSLCS
jgi:MinD-like ATPase involved in chromosome partitioning or flagellar assembly